MENDQAIKDMERRHQAELQALQRANTMTKVNAEREKANLLQFFEKMQRRDNIQMGEILKTQELLFQYISGEKSDKPRHELHQAFGVTMFTSNVNDEAGKSETRAKCGLTDPNENSSIKENPEEDMIANRRPGFVKAAISLFEKI
ncbi:hypothetical protein BaRGS_00023616 [Batillaria attramentaria]|uniref:Uncharacterized protein n=1 Tax=Batillaria attramentaria TaxID=370345 RepID=A0ABD0KDM3_9CAEN